MKDGIKEMDSPFSANDTSAADLQNIYSASEPVSKAPSLLLPSQELRRHCKKVAKYMECLKNHAAAIGGNATDGCGEFIPSGKDGTFEALKCSACSCHRNFHRKEIESDFPSCCFYPLALPNGTAQTKTITEHHCISHQLAVQGSSYQTSSPNKCSSIPSESDEKDVDDDGEVRVHVDSVVKMRKRFRTKFTQEQKEKMLSFAEKAGWTIQKLDEEIIQEFCQKTGIKRRVLKVWMHNNKYKYCSKENTIAD